MKNKIIVFTLLMMSALFSQIDKKSMVYDKSYVQEKFELKYPTIKKAITNLLL